MMKRKVKTLILRTAGTNCDKETAFAFDLAGAEADLMHINALIRDRSALDRYDILAIPGGFSYGDDIASGKILANELRFSLRSRLLRFVKEGKPVIGICNGFQILVKMGFLPDLSGDPGSHIEATLSLNDSGKFEDRWVYLKKVSGARSQVSEKCIWTRGLPEVIQAPVAHGEGKFMPKDDRVLENLKKNGQIVFRYTDREGNIEGYPHNPNGSVDNIAGICDTTGRIFGLMPHPERHVTFLQHPNWRRSDSEKKAMGIGLEIFKNGVKFARNCI